METVVKLQKISEMELFRLYNLPKTKKIDDTEEGNYMCFEKDTSHI